MIQPWLPSTLCRDAHVPLDDDLSFPTAIVVVRQGNPASGHQLKEERVMIEVDRDLFSYEIDSVAKSISRRQADEMTWADSLGNLRVLDRWRQEIVSVKHES